MSIFVGTCSPDALKRLSHHSLVRYDVTGVQSERLLEIIEADWRHLVQEKRVLNSPNYLREDGKPVIAIWGAHPSQSTFSAHFAQLRPTKVSALRAAITRPIKSAP